MSDPVADELAYLISRPKRKARQRRVLDALDEVCPNWELLARHPRLLAWLREPHPETRATWGDALIGISKEYDGTNLAILFHVAEGTLAGRRPHRGAFLAHGRYMAGQRLARHYEVVDVLGAGGFGEVLLVYSHEVGMRKFHAMKVLRSGPEVDAWTLARFTKEAYLLMGIRPHPCLSPTTMVERLPEGSLAILSEFEPPDALGRVTLADAVRSGELNPERQSRILLECCAGLQAAYRDGVKAHRDLKPANILLGARARARVADFGLAALDAGEELASGHGRAAPLGLLYTQDGQSFGTPPYMAPEQFVDARACDERSDIYSLGVLLFEMAGHGQLPFSPPVGAGWKAWAELHCSAAVPVLDHPLFPMIRRCLAKDPTARYQTVGELSQALTAVRAAHGWVPVAIESTDEFSIQSFHSRMNRAVGFMRLGQQRRAIPLFQECANRFDLAAADAYAYMVLCYRELHAYEKAIACGMKILVDQRSGDTEITLGYCYATLGRWGDAVPHYKRATHLKPTSANAWENLGRGLFVLGRSCDARSALQQCTDLADAGIEAWMLRAEVEATLNIYPDALDALMRAHALRGSAMSEELDRLVAVDEFVRCQRRLKTDTVFVVPAI